MKKLSTFLLAATLSVSVLVSKKSEAAIGLSTGGAAVIPLLVAGSGFGGVGLALGMYAASINTDSVSRCCGKKGTSYYVPNFDAERRQKIALGVALSALAFGSILLDEKSEEMMKYSNLSNQEALKLGINSAEQSSFNKKVNSINQIGKAITKKCTTQLLKEKSDDTLSDRDLSQIALCTDTEWENFKKVNPKVLTDDVYGVVQAIRSQRM